MNGRLWGIVIGLVLVLAAAYALLVKPSDDEHRRPVPADLASLPAQQESVAREPAAVPPPPAPVPAAAMPPAQGEPFPRRAGPRERAEQNPAMIPPRPPPPKTARQRFVRTRTDVPQVVLRGEPVPSHRLDEIMVWGTDRESLRGSIQDRHDEFVRCYSAWLAVEPELAGKLTMTFTIGRAHEADSLASVIALDVADSDLDHAAFEGCVVGALQDLTYEPPEENISVSYPLAFRATDNSP
jgi:hypothetical protein